jgi:hypothetical protein
MQLLLFRKNHARLACSVVNALATARCRYQLLRISDNRIFNHPLHKEGLIYNSISYKTKTAALAQPNCGLIIFFTYYCCFYV